MTTEIIQTNTDFLPINLIDKAITKGTDIASLEKLMDLQERWEKSQAQKEFNRALAKFQQECPTLTKNKAAHNCKYAPLGDIIAQIKDVLFDNGLSIRFEQDHSNGITVSCIVSHLDGHSESTTMSASPDKSGNKNDVQAIGSTVTYLQRYTLIGALGITTADEDMDGRINSNKVDPEYLNLLLSLCEQHVVNGIDLFRDFWKSLTKKQREIIGTDKMNEFVNKAKEHGATN
ncbi:ERF family protein [Gilliamella sp. Fer4-1]|uniref:ERF family protein n=1 Tax=Gilliamella sp. Fer4-1 TaxID=3120242 RepID=UPI00080E7120|nr:ERF family protein [Gilliamella apicola]OCG59015.1 hypothetical protein A9G30_11980 [Gilliamella apicola]